MTRSLLPYLKVMLFFVISISFYSNDEVSASFKVDENSQTYKNCDLIKAIVMLGENPLPKYSCSS